MEKYKNKKIGKTEIVCHVEKTPLGTGGALENAKKFIVNNTLVCNGDTYFDYRFEPYSNEPKLGKTGQI